MYERLPNPLFQPWFSPVEKGILERILRLVGAIEPNVEVGLHLCYGNWGDKHFVEPTDRELVTEVATVSSVLSKSKANTRSIGSTFLYRRTVTICSISFL